MKMKLYRFLRNKAAFDHGGMIHHDQQINDVLCVNPGLISNFPAPVYRKHQLVWMRIFKTYERLVWDRLWST